MAHQPRRPGGPRSSRARADRRSCRPSLVSQRNHGIDSRRSPRRNAGGECRDEAEEKRDRRERSPVERSHAEQHSFEDAREGSCARYAKADPGGVKSRPFRSTQTSTCPLRAPSATGHGAGAGRRTRGPMRIPGTAERRAIFLQHRLEHAMARVGPREGDGVAVDTAGTRRRPARSSPRRARTN